MGPRLREQVQFHVIQSLNNWSLSSIEGLTADDLDTDDPFWKNGHGCAKESGA